MRVLHEDLRWRVIYHQHLYGSSKKETADCLFTSTAFVSKIRRLYRRYGDVSRQRRRGRQRILTCKCLCLFVGLQTACWFHEPLSNISLNTCFILYRNRQRKQNSRGNGKEQTGTLYRRVSRLVSFNHRYLAKHFHNVSINSTPWFHLQKGEV